MCIHRHSVHLLRFQAKYYFFYHVFWVLLFGRVWQQQLQCVVWQATIRIHGHSNEIQSKQVDHPSSQPTSHWEIIGIHSLFWVENGSIILVFMIFTFFFSPVGLSLALFLSLHFVLRATFLFPISWTQLMTVDKKFMSPIASCLHYGVQCTSIGPLLCIVMARSIQQLTLIFLSVVGIFLSLFPRFII